MYLLHRIERCGVVRQGASPLSARSRILAVSGAAFDITTFSLRAQQGRPPPLGACRRAHLAQPLRPSTAISLPDPTSNLPWVILARRELIVQMMLVFLQLPFHPAGCWDQPRGPRGSTGDFFLLRSGVVVARPENTLAVPAHPRCCHTTYHRSGRSMLPRVATKLLVITCIQPRAVSHSTSSLSPCACRSHDPIRPVLLVFPLPYSLDYRDTIEHGRTGKGLQQTWAALYL